MQAKITLEIMKTDLIRLYLIHSHSLLFLSKYFFPTHLIICPRSSLSNWFYKSFLLWGISNVTRAGWLGQQLWEPTREWGKQGAEKSAAATAAQQNQCHGGSQKSLLCPCILLLWTPSCFVAPVRRIIFFLNFIHKMPVAYSMQLGQTETAVPK